jgi:hypothetical protein
MLYLIHPLLFFNWNSINSNKKNYFINNSGFILSLKNRTIKFLKRRMDRAGYFTIRLTEDGNIKTHFLHRLIAETFIPNTNNKPFVNHINGIKTDNRIENLEWVTHSENVQHGYAMGLCKLESRQTPIIDICTGKIFPSIKNAAEFNQIKYTTCKGYLNGSRPNPTCLRYLSR